MNAITLKCYLDYLKIKRKKNLNYKIYNKVDITTKVKQIVIFKSSQQKKEILNFY